MVLHTTDKQAKLPPMGNNKFFTLSRTTDRSVGRSVGQSVVRFVGPSAQFDRVGLTDKRSETELNSIYIEPDVPACPRRDARMRNCASGKKRLKRLNPISFL